MAKVFNMHVAGLVRRGRRFRWETHKAASAGLTDVSAADLQRANDYLQALINYADYVTAAPILDLPESSPMEQDLGPAESLTMPENDSFADLITLYDVMEKELVNSQSARQMVGLVSHDERRFRELVGSMQSFLSTYVATTLPLDLPESSPLREMTGPGRTGV